MNPVYPKRPRRRPGSATARLSPRQKSLVDQMRRCFQRCGVHAAPDQVARLAALAFQAAFPPGKRRSILGQAIVAGISARRAMLASEGGSIPAGEAALKIGISVRALGQRYREGSILGWHDEHSRATRYPAWQFGPHGLLPGIEDVLRRFNEAAYLNDMARLMFFLNRFEFLDDKRPLDCLRAGDIESALRATSAYLE